MSIELCPTHPEAKHFLVREHSVASFFLVKGVEDDVITVDSYLDDQADLDELAVLFQCNKCDYEIILTGSSYEIDWT